MRTLILFVAVAVIAALAQQPSPHALVTQAEYVKWQTDLTNWGRWGKDDEMGTLNLIRMKRQYNRLQAETQSIRQENQILSRRIEALKTDPAAIESLARDQLGLAKEGELVYEFYDH